MYMARAAKGELLDLVHKFYLILVISTVDNYPQVLTM